MKFLILTQLLAVLVVGVRFAHGQTIQLITNPNFSLGFEVQAPNLPPTIEGNIQWDASNGPPVWTLSQWSSQSTIFGEPPTNTPSGAFRYTNADKEIIAGGSPAATDSGLVLSVNAFSEYGGQFRSSSDPWPHLLVSQRISDPGGHIGSQSPSLAEMTSLNFNIDARLLYDHRNISAGYDSSLHAAQYNIFYTIQNLKVGSPGFGDFLWFGTALYDDRHDVTEIGTLIDASSQKLIYDIGIELFTNDRIADGNWMSIGGDLLPHMKAALNFAWSQGLLLDSQDYADYRVGGMNMGWEIPGLNDASLQIRNYSVVADLGPPPFTPFQDDALTRGLWHMDTIEACCGSSFVRDDNSTGRDAHALLLRPQPDTDSPQSTSGAPGMGSALLFDGVDDYAFAPGVLGDTVDHISIDFLMRPDSLPDIDVDNFMATVNMLPLQTYLQDDGTGNGTGQLLSLAFDDNSQTAASLVSQGGLALNEWHEVHVELTEVGGANGFGKLWLTVDGVTFSVDLTASLGDLSPLAVIGKPMTANAQFFDGAMDEIRIATGPAVSAGIPGDFDEDGDVDGADFLLWQSTQSVGDFADWQSHFGRNNLVRSDVVALPEPTSLILLTLLLSGCAISARTG